MELTAKPRPGGVNILVFEKPYVRILFDMDGTFVDSRAVVGRVWRKWAERNNLDLAAILEGQVLTDA
jgi:hypothetical protein